MTDTNNDDASAQASGKAWADNYHELQIELTALRVELQQAQGSWQTQQAMLRQLNEELQQAQQRIELYAKAEVRATEELDTVRKSRGRAIEQGKQAGLRAQQAEAALTEAQAHIHHLIHGDMVRTNNGNYICGLDKCAYHKDDPYRKVEGTEQLTEAQGKAALAASMATFLRRLENLKGSSGRDLNDGDKRWLTDYDALTAPATVAKPPTNAECHGCSAYWREKQDWKRACPNLDCPDPLRYTMKPATEANDDPHPGSLNGLRLKPTEANDGN